VSTIFSLSPLLLHKTNSEALSFGPHPFALALRKYNKSEAHAANLC